MKEKEEHFNACLIILPQQSLNYIQFDGGAICKVNGYVFDEEHKLFLYL